MYYLLLDSSTKFVCVGLSNGTEIIDSICYDAWQRQSEVMAPEIDKILTRNNLTGKDLNGVVVGIGPGSYTGVRIAITLAKTLAYILKLGLYTTSSLSLFKIKDEPTICLLNAKAGRSYFAVYKGNECLVNDTVLTNEETIKYIEEHPTYLLSGETKHLNKESSSFDLISNLNKAIKEENKVDNLFKVNPTYLKDLY